MSKNLVIVESPAKAKTIEGYLGKDFAVKSSYGHVRDLPKDDKAIDIERGFIPTYEISEDKKEIIKELRKLSDKAELVWLATDSDREGEAISWHLKEVLELPDNKTKRIVFTEITKKAILESIQNPRAIDIDLVHAQQARRILDRLVGFEISPVLWKKIKTGLSAGRVQSVAVRLIVEREREIEQFNSTSTFKVTAEFDVGKGKTLIAELPVKFDTQEQAESFLKKCIGAKYTISNLEKKPVKKSPAPPFTTSTLQQEASRKLSFSVAQTMTIAQKLYEAGKISYMRTDSVNLSDDALASAKEAILNNFGEKYWQIRKYTNKNESAQEAHEAIRPTDFSVQKVSSDRNEQRLYELIWKRAIASQMADAQLERTIATINISTTEEQLTATGEVVKFDGFLKVYMESEDDENNGDEDAKGMLPPLEVGQIIELNEMQALQRFSRPAPRYTEASLVKKLEEMGIGRPSTYAPTISTIQKRGYVVKESREGKERVLTLLKLAKDNITTSTKTEITGQEKAKLFPTDLAMIVTDFLMHYFPTITDYSFTATVEKEFDEIAEGKKKWDKMLDEFYKTFHKTVENTEKIDRSSVATSRELGVHPETGEKVIVRLGRYGPIAQIGEADEKNNIKPKFASLRKGQFIESITLEEALELFKLPREAGMYEGKPMKVAIGRFGPYILHDNKFYSLGKEDDPLEVTEERCIEIIEQKRKADAEKIIKEFPENDEVKILNGRWGPYIVVGKKNIKVPKDRNPKDITLEECIALAENAPEKKGRFGKKMTTVTKPDKQTEEKISEQEDLKKAASRKLTVKKKSTESKKKKSNSTKASATTTEKEKKKKAKKKK
ncbi:MAG: type I DNA topoisomerase [Cytophagaceae bacterium]|nr:type I DNA topoisomerase [Cytophagaceae bacterium]MDW8456775.1 type I DNA topoisomerase [Cytophagaceae bacterium]